MNLFSLKAVLGLDTKEYEKGLDEAKAKSDVASTAMGVALGNFATGAVSKLASAGRSAFETAAKFETSFAQVKTIMNPEQMGFGDMQNAISDLSSSMGISFDQLSETVYNAISATGDTANAVALTETASKLATAGFTDTSSALGVLTTAMNSYGISAEESMGIADSLIQVQNLGVTTVSELSAAMGKAIATGSAYGVDLGNIESAYVSLTKGGISTAESTTYISSMMNELGDTGSKVSKLLKEKTGKSFSDLMSNGATLADVLGILQDAVNGDSTALMNLWGSAEAGKASNAIVNQGLKEFNENLKQIEGSSGATETAYATMSDTFEHKMSVMKESWKNLLADGMQPVENFAAKNILPALQMLIDNFGTVGPIILGVTVALGSLAIALNMHSMISKVTTGFKALNAVMAANPIGIVIALIAGLVSWFVVMYNTNEDFRKKVNEVWAEFKKAIGEGIDFVVNKFREWMDKAKELKDKIVAIPGDIKREFEDLVASAKQWGKDFIDGFLESFNNNPIVQAAKGLAEGISSVLHFSRPDEGPLRDYETWMPDFVDGLTKGLKANAYKLQDAVSDMAADMNGSFNITGNAAASSSHSVTTNTYNINISAANVKEFNDIIRIAQSERMSIRQGAMA